MTCVSCWQTIDFEERSQSEHSNETARAVRYHQEALVGIQTELKQAAVTDGVLGTVAGFLIYAVSIHLQQA